MYRNHPAINTLRSAIPFFLLASIVLLQYFFDIEKKDRPFIPPAVLPAQAIKLGNLGLHSASSVLMWLNTVQYIPSKTAEMIEVTNNLDPKFSYPYAFAALTLPSMKLADKAVTIAKNGLANADPDWRIPYYLATAYHIFLHDRKNAAFYFDMAVNTPGAPEKIKSISARYSANVDELERIKAIWTSIYETSNDPEMQERAKNYLLHVEIVRVLEKALNIYKTRYGYYPLKLEDLVQKKILKDIPLSPLGVSFDIKPGGKIIIQ